MNQPIQSLALSAPLAPRPDMLNHWHDLDLDFDTAAQRLVTAHQLDGRARDQCVLDLRTWGVSQDQGRFTLAPLTGHQSPVLLRSTALGHLCARLQAPVEFLRDRLPAELQLALLNYLLASQERNLPSQLRLRGNEVSAIVSDRYAPLDPEAFVEAVREALVEHGVLGDARVKALATGTTDALRLVFPAESAELRLGDITAAGLDFTTSSVGKSALHVSGVLWRLICTNGLRAPERLGRFSFRHVGETQRLRDGLSDAVPTALFHARGFLGTWRKAVTSYITEVSQAIEAMRELTQQERVLVTEELKQDSGTPQLPEKSTVYDLVNAVTAAAHKVEPARRLELESLAGQWLVGQVGEA